jgi:hypothetical protein
MMKQEGINDGVARQKQLIIDGAGWYKQQASFLSGMLTHLTLFQNMEILNL